MRTRVCVWCICLSVLLPGLCGAVVVTTDPPGADVWTSPWHDPAMQHHGQSPVTIARPTERVQLIVRLAGYLPVYTELDPAQEALSLTLAPVSEDPGDVVRIGWRDLVPGLWVAKSNAPGEGWRVPYERIPYRWGADLHWSPDGRYVACEHVVETGFNDEASYPYYMSYLHVFDTVGRTVQQVAWANLGRSYWRHEPTWSFDSEYLVYERSWARGYHHGGVAAYRPADRTTRMVIGNGETGYYYPHMGADGDVYCVAATADDKYLLTRVDWDGGAAQALVPDRDCRHLMTTIHGDLLWRDRGGMMLYDAAGSADLVRLENEAELLEWARTHPIPDWLRGEGPGPTISLRPDLTTVEFNDGFGDWGVRWYGIEDYRPGIYPRDYTWSRAEGVRESELTPQVQSKALTRLERVRWSRDGNWLLVTGERRLKGHSRPILLVKADGSESVEILRLPGLQGGYGLDWGPGNCLAVTIVTEWETSRRSLWVLDTPHAPPRLLLEPVHGGSCSWSPDGSQIAVVVGEGWGKTQVGLVDVATGKVKTITDVGPWESVAWHPSKPELAFTLRIFPEGAGNNGYGVMALDGHVLWEDHGRYGYACGARWYDDERIYAGEDGYLLLDRDGNTEPVGRPLRESYGMCGSVIEYTRDGRYAALLDDHAIIIAEADALTYDPERPRSDGRLKPGREPVRIIFPEGEWLQGEPCPTFAPVQAQ